MSADHERIVLLRSLESLYGMCYMSVGIDRFICAFTPDVSFSKPTVSSVNFLYYLYSISSISIFIFIISFFPLDVISFLI